MTLLTFIWTPTQCRSFKNKRFCCNFLSGGEIKVINLKMLLVFSAQKCWLAYQEGLKPASASSLRVAANTVAMAPHTRCCHPPPLPLIHNHKRRLNCVGVCVQSLARRLLSPPQRSRRRGISSQKLSSSLRGETPRLMTLSPPRIQPMEVFVVNLCMNIYDHMLK